MYSTCLHCHASLGRNESIEAFPVGKRLAFDAAKGRLWVVCPACGRWNLTPLEERWEAVEDCERQFRDARRKVTRGEIGLAHLRSGAHLVRVGAPATREMAAWRYGRELRKRWLTRGVPLTTIGVGVGGMQYVVYSHLGSVLPGMLAIGGLAAIGMATSAVGRTRLALPDGRVVRVSPASYGSALLRSTGHGGWGLHYDYEKRAALLEGTAATHTLRNLLTTVNFRGAPSGDLEAAVALLADSRSPGAFIRRLARAGERTHITSLAHYPEAVRCALEMALHDEAERRAMEGELDALEAEWIVAEEIATMADGMFLPANVMAKLDALRGSHA